MSSRRSLYFADCHRTHSPSRYSPKRLHAVKVRAIYVMFVTGWVIWPDIVLVDLLVRNVLDAVAGVILGNIKGVRSLTVSPIVNVATWAQSKRATTEVPAVPQEILFKSLIDSSLTPTTPPQILSQPGSIINESPRTPAARTVTSNGSRLYPSEEDISSFYLLNDRERTLPLLPALGEMIRILFVAFRMSWTMVTYVLSSDTQVILILLRLFVFRNLLDLKYCRRIMKPTFQVTLDDPTHDELLNEDLTLNFSKGIAFAPPEEIAYISAVNEDPSSVGGTLPSPSTSDIKSKVNAPATFCRLVRIILRDIPHVLSYFDDSVVYPCEASGKNVLHRFCRGCSNEAKKLWTEAARGAVSVAGKRKGGGPSYFDEHVSLCELVAIKKIYGDQFERIREGGHRELKSIQCDKTIEVTKLGNGDLEVELKSNDQAKKLGAIATYLGIPVTVSPHKSLNSSKGVIPSRGIRCCSEEKMVEELSGVTHARRINVRRGDDKFRTDTVFLIFDSPKPPSRIRAGYLTLDVRPYVPFSMRSHKCQRYGHCKDRCKKPAASTRPVDAARSYILFHKGAKSKTRVPWFTQKCR
ncbi:RNA-directed DNA polymerase from mobile element jockey [Plakobranchus ocellatus]|uniref:RNA-directed DNA polymerase from mobile element jockey n=1 Tax=Plakobranchus ocellatus TaxID=259542 RepID=A0AAV3Z0Q3_9GAST|nr:RNA-directed DNA polymerase from mobile element jockey [Plakobranchus ocellatus]